MNSSSITRTGWVATLICLLLQVLIAPHIAIFGATPFFLLIPLVLVATSADMTMSVIFGFLLGLLYDLGSGEPLGTMCMAFTICVVVCQFMGAGDASGGGALFAGAVCVVVTMVLQGILMVITGHAASFASILLTRVLIGIIYSGIITLVGLGIAQGVGSGSRGNRGLGTRLR